MPDFIERKYKAHPTTYNGVTYRSRLEARWAAFFRGARWQARYEPFDLEGWSPDFALYKDGRRHVERQFSSVAVLVEVKPEINDALMDHLRKQAVANNCLVMAVDAQGPTLLEGDEYNGLSIGWVADPSWGGEIFPARLGGFRPTDDNEVNYKAPDYPYHDPDGKGWPHHISIHLTSEGNNYPCYDILGFGNIKKFGKQLNMDKEALKLWKDAGNAVQHLPYDGQARVWEALKALDNMEDFIRGEGRNSWLDYLNEVANPLLDLVGQANDGMRY